MESIRRKKIVRYECNMHFRISKEERKLLEELTKKNGFPSMTDCLRFLINQSVDKNPEVKKSLDSLVYEINKIGNNINQIVKNYNAYLIKQKDVELLHSEMDKVYQTLDNIKDKLS